MCWAVILFLLTEAAADDAAAAKKRADRAAEKKRQAAAEDASKNGGVLGGAVASPVNTKVEVQKCFEKLVSSNSSWLELLWKDAQDYARDAQPRSEETLKQIFHSGQTSLPPTEVSTMFVQNVWPSLKTRGWTARILVEGPHAGKTQYSYNGNEVTLTFIRC